jgi:hypothetical protein
MLFFSKRKRKITDYRLGLIVYLNGLLPGSILKGEDEYMIIGGEYRVERMR